MTDTLAPNAVTVETVATAPTARTRVRRIAENARYDQATVHAIVDAAYLCHVAFHDGNSAHCIPTVCWRQDGHLYIHGSNGSRMLKQLAEAGANADASADACVTITHLDGLVLARAAFNHTMNYRSVMIYGRFETVSGDLERRAAMEALMEKIAPGRQNLVRAGSDKEYAATTVLRIALAEAAVKQRSGGPIDDAADMAMAVWSGELPLIHAHGRPVPDALSNAPVPDQVNAWHGESP